MRTVDCSAAVGYLDLPELAGAVVSRIVWNNTGKRQEFVLPGTERHENFVQIFFPPGTGACVDTYPQLAFLLRPEYAAEGWTVEEVEDEQM